MSRRYVVLGLVVLVMVVVLVVVVDPAFAAPAHDPTTTAGKDTGEIGTSIKDQLVHLGRPIVPALGGLIGLAAVAKRDWAMGLSLLGITLLVSAFLWAGDSIGSAAQTIAEKVF
jgi:hypothetical protein